MSPAIPMAASPAAPVAPTSGLVRLEERLRRDILPFWSGEGFDRRRSLFHEAMGFDGRPIEDAPRRLMVQARQIHVFSHAARCGLFTEGADAATRALDAVLGGFSHPDGGFVFSLAPDDTPQARHRDSYAHAFVLFALASAWRLTGERRVKTAIDETLDVVDRRLWDDGAGGMHDRYPDPGPRKSQNPQMHLLEALLALHEAFPTGRYLDRAARLVGLLEARILRRDPRLIPEFCEADWSDLDDPAQRNFEPGHHFEWTWLLDWFGRLGGRVSPDIGHDLWRTARTYGMDAGGRLFDEVGFDLAPRKTTHRLWPHAEAIKAAAARAARGDDDAGPVAAAMFGVLDELFLGRPFAGGWVDRTDAAGRPLLDTVPASSLYHVYGAWAEARRVFGPLASSGD